MVAGERTKFLFTIVPNCCSEDATGGSIQHILDDEGG